MRYFVIVLGKMIIIQRTQNIYFYRYRAAHTHDGGGQMILSRDGAEARDNIEKKNENNK